MQIIICVFKTQEKKMSLEMSIPADVRADA